MCNSPAALFPGMDQNKGFPFYNYYFSSPLVIHMISFASSAKPSMRIRAVAKKESKLFPTVPLHVRNPQGAHARRHALQLKHEEEHFRKPIFIYVKLKQREGIHGLRLQHTLFLLLFNLSDSICCPDDVLKDQQREFSLARKTNHVVVDYFKVYTHKADVKKKKS